MSGAIRRIAEQRISEAVRDGRLSVEGWRNRPLSPDNECLVPEELRLAYKILKNAGYLPAEIETRKEIEKVEDLLVSCRDERTRVRQLKKLHFLLLKLHTMKGECSIEEQETYYRKVVERISLREKDPE
jgi:hypothetical protein